MCIDSVKSSKYNGLGFQIVMNLCSSTYSPLKIDSFLSSICVEENLCVFCQLYIGIINKSKQFILMFAAYKQIFNICTHREIVTMN